jgi:hypothetical protein
MHSFKRQGPLSWYENGKRGNVWQRLWGDATSTAGGKICAGEQQPGKKGPAASRECKGPGNRSRASSLMLLTCRAHPRAARLGLWRRSECLQCCSASNLLLGLVAAPFGNASGCESRERSMEFNGPRLFCTAHVSLAQHHGAQPLPQRSAGALKRDFTTHSRSPKLRNDPARGVFAARCAVEPTSAGGLPSRAPVCPRKIDPNQ